MNSVHRQTTRLWMDHNKSQEMLKWSSVLLLSGSVLSVTCLHFTSVFMLVFELELYIDLTCSVCDIWTIMVFPGCSWYCRAQITWKGSLTTPWMKWTSMRGTFSLTQFYVHSANNILLCLKVLAAYYFTLWMWRCDKTWANKTIFIFRTS